jgi:hypothetical protein
MGGGGATEDRRNRQNRVIAKIEDQITATDLHGNQRIENLFAADF